KLRERHIAALL
ncbi:hypothetical protein EC82524_1813B, partial [Escherichia coli 8.2524]